MTKRISKEAHKSEMVTRRERQMSRAPGFTEVRKKPTPNLKAFVETLKRPQPTLVRNDHYVTLHPTRGWKRVANARIFARQIMDRILGREA